MLWYQHPVSSAVFSIVRIHKARNQGVEMGVSPLTITCSDPIAKFLLPLPTTCGLLHRGFSSKGRNASTRRYSDSIQL